MYQFELHAHTRECDPTAYIMAEDLVSMYAEKGYQGLVITDHYIHLFDEWFRDEVANMNHRERIKRWLRGYEVAKKKAEEYGMTVLLGAEVRFDGYPNDYLVYGADEEFYYQAPRLNQLKNIHEMMALLPEDVCVVQAHPFRRNMVVEAPEAVWGLEVHNGGTPTFHNELARQCALHYGKCMTSGSDTHIPLAVGRGGIQTEEPILTQKDLIRTLRSGAYTLIQNGCVNDYKGGKT